jgi:hypothetical protein
MKNLFFLMLLSGCLWMFNGCSDDDEKVETNAEKAIGKWIATEINGETPLTDSLFCMEFRTDKVEMYAIGSRIDEHNSKWTEGDDYTYSINNDIITIDGKDTDGKTIHVEMKIHTLTSTQLKYSVNSYTYDGVSIPDTKIYTCKKADVDYSSKIVGVWHGKCTSANTTDTTNHYWEYFADGKYNYYYTNANGGWVKKSDNEGKYFLYGDLFVSNYMNDFVAGTQGWNYECWNISIIDNNKMKWTGKRADKTVVYEMERAIAPPSNASNR